MPIVPQCVLESSAISVILNDLILRDSEAGLVSVLPIGELEHSFGMFSAQRAISVLSCDWRSHLCENHNVLP